MALSAECIFVLASFTDSSHMLSEADWPKKTAFAFVQRAASKARIHTHTHTCHAMVYGFLPARYIAGMRVFMEKSIDKQKIARSVSNRALYP